MHEERITSIRDAYFFFPRCLFHVVTKKFGVATLRYGGIGGLLREFWFAPSFFFEPFIPCAPASHAARTSVRTFSLCDDGGTEPGWLSNRGRRRSPTHCDLRGSAGGALGNSPSRRGREGWTARGGRSFAGGAARRPVQDPARTLQHSEDHLILKALETVTTASSEDVNRLAVNDGVHPRMKRSTRRIVVEIRQSGGNGCPSVLNAVIQV